MILPCMLGPASHNRNLYLLISIFAQVDASLRVSVSRISFARATEVLLCGEVLIISAEFEAVSQDPSVEKTHNIREMTGMS